MPDRLYHARNHPPTLQDRIAAHWLEITLALMGILRGALSLLSNRFDFVAQPVDRIPAFFGALVALSLIVGGVIWINSIVHRYDTLNRFYLHVRTGLALSAFSWLSYFVSAIVFNPTHAVVWSVTFSAFLATAGLYFQTFVNEKTIRRLESIQHD